VSTAVHPIDDNELHAYVDGQLTPDRVEAVEDALRREPELASRVTSLRELNSALRDALDPILAEPIPERLLAAATAPATRSVAARRWFAPVFAAAAMLVVGLGVGWTMRGALIEEAGTPTTFARQAAFTHALYAGDVRRPVEVWANEEKSLVTWLTKRLGHQVHAPDLNALGYALVGGRLGPEQGALAGAQQARHGGLLPRAQGGRAENPEEAARQVREAAPHTTTRRTQPTAVPTKARASGMTTIRRKSTRKP